jgi:hypothetical protein
MAKTLANLSEEGFEQMLENMPTPKYDALTAEEFFCILAAMDVADEIHLTGRSLTDEKFPFEGGKVPTLSNT